MKKVATLSALLIVFIVLLYQVFKQQNNPLSAHPSPNQNDNNSNRGNLSVSGDDSIRNMLKSFDVPISFYGIVEDEQGQPLSQVDVKWSIMKGGALIREMGLPTTIRGETTSDNEGRFRIESNGKTLQLGDFTKVGYREAPGLLKVYGFGGSSNPHIPDENSPRRFQLIKHGQPTAVEKNANLSFDWDGTPKRIDIGVEGFKETLILNPVKGAQVPGERGFDWALTISIENGLVASAQDGGSQLAPDSGYEKEIKIEAVSGPKWMAYAEVNFFAKSRTGNHAKIRINAYPDRTSLDPVTAGLYVLWNLHGGRTFHLSNAQ